MFYHLNLPLFLTETLQVLESKGKRLFLRHWAVSYSEQIFHKQL